MTNIYNIDLTETVDLKCGGEEWTDGRYLLEVRGKAHACDNVWSPSLTVGDDLSDLDALAEKKLGDTHRTLYKGAKIWDRVEHVFVEPVSS